MSPDSPGQPPAHRLARWMERRSTLVIAGLVLATAALVAPFLWMQPTASASQEPAGEIFECQRLSVDRFASSVHRAVYIVEAREGDLLRRQPLLELLEGARAVRDDPEVGPRLHTHTDPRGTTVKGIRTIADATEGVLRIQGIDGLATATEAQVTTAVGRILDAASPRAFGLSVRARRDGRTGRWSAPALLAVLLADNEALGGGGQSATLGARDTTKEEFARRVQGLLRGERRQIRVWGLAIDVNLTSAEQGRAAGPFIGLTIFAVLALVGLTFRSYWAVAVTGLSLGALIIWLKGLSNLVGLKNDQILSIIVPIAMISFGVDFAFHAIGRYREESRLQVSGRRAFVVGGGGVLGALVLAMASDSAAFLSNVTSGIESLVQFGVAAAMGAVAAFVMLGLFTPLVLMRIEERVGRPRRGISAVALAAGGGVLAALGAMAVVSLTVFVLPWLGAAALGGYALLFVAAPALVAGWLRRPRPDADRPPPAGGGYDFMGRVVVEVARLRHLILPLVAVFSGLCTYYALKVEANFDVKDFFASTTDFVVALDKFDRHVGQQGGEPAVVYVEGRLTEPKAIRALRQFVEGARKLDTDRLAKDDAGWVRMEAGLLDLLDLASTSPAARDAISRATSVEVRDNNGDRIPDTSSQIAAVYRFAARRGLPGVAGKPARTADQVRTVLWQESGRKIQATHIDLRLPGSRVQENIREARAVLLPLVEQLQQRLRQQEPSARAVLTGRPVVRQAALGAILRAFRLSLPVAVVLCLIISAIFMRSLRFAAVSIVPILLVVAWLYAFMYAFGFDINVITATIGAISIGIGIDFAVHFTMRFREELERRPTRREALRAAGSGTGGALLASGASSVLGFAILAFAPMPLFASYGLLTAVMILLASAASLLVLPSLLMLVTRQRGG